MDDRYGPPGAIAEVDLFSEQHHVRETVRKNTYTGKTYNSIENIAQFFQERRLKTPPAPGPVPPSPRKVPVAKPTTPARTAATGKVPKSKLRAGVTVEHPRFGTGMVLRQEGDGEEAKLTVSFPGHGLKKMIAKYAKLKVTG